MDIPFGKRDGGSWQSPFVNSKWWQAIVISLAFFFCSLPLLFHKDFVNPLLRPIEYNEAITLLELSGQEHYPWPNSSFRAEEYLRTLDQVSRLEDCLSAVLSSDTHPLLYYILAWSWRSLFGSDLYTLRIFSLLCALGACFLFQKLAEDFSPTLRESRSKIPFLLFLVFLLGHEDTFAARNYMLALLLTTACLSVVWNGRRPMLAGVFAGLAVSTHYFTILSSLPAAYFRLRRGPSLDRAVAGKFLAGFLFGSPIAVFSILRQLHSRSSQYFGPYRMADEFLAGLESMSHFFFQNSLLGLTFPIELVLIAFLSLIFFRRRRTTTLYILVVYFAAVLFLGAVFQKQLLSLGPSRYWFFLLPITLLHILPIPPRHKATSSLCAKRQYQGAVGFLLLIFFPLGLLKFANQDRPMMVNSPTLCVPGKRVLIGIGYGRGFPGAILGHMKEQSCPGQEVQMITPNTDLAGVSEVINPLEVVFLPSGEPPTALQEKFLLNLLPHTRGTTRRSISKEAK